MSGGEGVRNPTDTTQLEADIAELAADVALIQADVTDILAIANGLPTLSETGGTVTTDGTEQNVYINSTPLGIFRPVCVKIDFTNHTAGETVVIREYYQIKAGVPAPILQNSTTYAGVPANPLINIDLQPNRFGVKVTIEKTAGANRDYDWEAFYEI